MGVLHGVQEGAGVRPARLRMPTGFRECLFPVCGGLLGQVWPERMEGGACISGCGVAAQGQKSEPSVNMSDGQLARQLSTDWWGTTLKSLVPGKKEKVLLAFLGAWGAQSVLPELIGLVSQGSLSLYL